LQEVENLKKLRGGDRYYRIRIGDYRIGLAVEESTVIFVRFLHRKDVYRYFP
jgi:mRNA interferase RelE/StbE